MNLQTYTRDVDTAEPLDWPLYHVDDEGRPVKCAPDLPFRPGDTVCHQRGGGTGYGTVVVSTDDQIVVLWSEPPAPDTFANVTFPTIKRVNPTLISQTLVSVQPMSSPASALFYMDYAYGSGSLGPTDDPERTQTTN